MKMSAEYYQKNKERLQKKARERYQDLSVEGKNKKRQYACERHSNLSEEEKNNKCQYGHKRYKNLPEDEKQSLVGYRKNYSKMYKIKNNLGPKKDFFCLTKYMTLKKYFEFFIDCAG